MMTRSNTLKCSSKQKSLSVMLLNLFSGLTLKFRNEVNLRDCSAWCSQPANEEIVTQERDFSCVSSLLKVKSNLYSTHLFSVSDWLSFFLLFFFFTAFEFFDNYLCVHSFTYMYSIFGLFIFPEILISVTLSYWKADRTIGRTFIRLKIYFVTIA